MTPIKKNPIRSCTETPATIKKTCARWLSRLGVQEHHIEYDYDMYERDKPWAEIYFKLNNQNYKFRSDQQGNFKLNLKAIELFLHNRVISIERGIEETAQAFAGYAQIGYDAGKPTPYTPLPKGHFISCINLAEVKGVYKAKAKILHPDVSTGSQEAFAELKKQYDEATKYFEGFGKC